MYKVLIVDDELIIRTNLKYMLNWETYGFTLCGEAVNGQEALHLIEKEIPDILLLDMRMPVMDGLQLSYEVKNNYPTVQMVVLSNYDDFNYVKNTLKNGAIDYILKHNLNNETLLDALNRAKTAIESNNSKEALGNVPEAATLNNLMALREKLVIQLLTGLYKNEDEIKKHFDTLQIKINTSNVIFIMMVIDDYRSMMDYRNLKDISLLEFSIINITEEILNSFGDGLITHIANEKFAILLSFSNYRSTAQIEKRIHEILQRISLCLKEFINVSVSFSIGDMCESITEIDNSYKTAESGLKNRFYAGKSSVIRERPASDEKTFNTGLSIDMEKRLTTHIKLQHKNELLPLLGEIFDGIKRERRSLPSSQTIFFDLLSIVNRICKENQIVLSTVYASDKTPHELLTEIETLEEARAWFSDVFIRLLTALGYEDIESDSEYVKKTLSFIKNHYAEDISLTYISDQINISSTYLSTLFKEETGEGFSQFLIQYRLDKAKALLEENKTDIKDIVKLCGFSDYAYFFKIFKKKMGMTPKEFVSNSHRHQLK